jgi:hypothetical protein
MLLYGPSCLLKFPKGTPCSPMFFFHALPCLFLEITVDTKETRDIIASDASIFGAKTQDRKEVYISIYT